MSYVMMVLLMGLVLGLVAVASNPSPYFAALGLVVVAGMGCGVVVGYGGSFLSLVLFLIYLGGMLVVFAYSAALAAEPYPETLFDRSVGIYMMVYSFVVAVLGAYFSEGWYEGTWTRREDLTDYNIWRADTAGVAFLYSFGGGLLLISAGVLLLTLFVVLELTRGLTRGTIRAV